jgi:hypothetical protein
MKTLHTSGVYRQCLENLRQKRNKKANYSKLDFTIIVLEQLFEHSKESEVMQPTIDDLPELDAGQKGGDN